MFTLIIDADWTFHGWDIAIREDADSCEGNWSGVPDDALPALIGPVAAAVLIARRNHPSEQPCSP
jgi:hypothetical protein